LLERLVSRTRPCRVLDHQDPLVYRQESLESWCGPRTRLEALRDRLGEYVELLRPELEPEGDHHGHPPASSSSAQFV
jgi:hypothetical protein